MPGVKDHHEALGRRADGDGAVVLGVQVVGQGLGVAPAGPGQAQLAALGQEGGYGVLLWLDAGGAAAESLADTRCLVTVRLKQLVDF